jgi:hypothetical protein
MGSRASGAARQPLALHRMWFAGAAIVCVALAVTLVRAGTADSAIRLGTGIGPLRLGMTEQQVRRALGRPSTVNRARSGRIYIVSMNYYMRGDYRVTLRGRRGAVRVTLIGTVSRQQRTQGGLRRTRACAAKTCAGAAEAWSGATAASARAPAGTPSS